MKYMVSVGLLVDGEPTRNSIIDGHLLYLTPDQYEELYDDGQNEDWQKTTEKVVLRNDGESGDEFDEVLFDL